MRSGIPADDEKCEAPVNGKIDDESLISNLNKQKLDFPPGRYFAYSNCAYNLAGVVLARVSKVSYAQFIGENFFQPLGMTSSYALGSREEANFAQGYGPQARRWKKSSQFRLPVVPRTRITRVAGSSSRVE
jgi:CubicO group peptidase (beta-lactamase class C family)